jgi:hypothetical protein
MFLSIRIYSIHMRYVGIRCVNIYISFIIQGVPGGKISILGDHIISHSKEKLYTYMCPIPNGFRDTAISLYSTLYTVQTSNTPRPHTSCKVH